MRTARSENSLQWPLGMTCREDESCIHIGHDAHNMSILRCQATLGSGLAAKRKQAGWDNDTYSWPCRNGRRLPGAVYASTRNWVLAPGLGALESPTCQGPEVRSW